MAGFEELIACGDSVDVTGWNFAWLQGRATEERPPWGYAQRLAERLTRAQASLDIQTGGGEVLAVSSRHPATIWWAEIARVLRPGGTYFAQHVGPASAFELIEFFLGPHPQGRRGRHPDDEAASARAAGLELVDLKTASTRLVIYDIAAVVYLLRKLIWWVPRFTVEAYRDRLRDLHDLIEREGRFVAHSTRHLIEARRP